jgi:hypothetical protein
MKRAPRVHSAVELLRDAGRLRAMARLVPDRDFADSLEEEARKLEALAERNSPSSR